MKKSAALFACFALALSSCAAAPKDTSLKAQLDFENNYITLPLDEYDMSDQALDITYRAYLLILKECYAKKGYDFEILENGLVSGNASQYGSWNVKHAANHFTSSKVREEQERIYESIPEDVRASCREEHREELDMLYFDEADEKKYRPVGRISGEAYQRAQADPEWKKARSDWWDCQRQEGLTPRTGDGEWTSKETANLNADDPKVLEEVIRLATIEAQCSEKVRLAQRLGDLEASYQGPLIEKNQALLNDLKAYRDAKIAKAREIIATHQ
ncbi:MULTISPECIES: hypothetical protein [Rothia]|jgi:hypothetical protein|uniref:hypothetical protein n=1 Tax=Rothia TaxID=32207 RepID=UPI00066DE7D2|nr:MULTISPECIES: hypothetical protein [Rothia]OFJ98628.1 hypothetical protein HMPREF2836_08560 [Rothia sp. HMSC065C12]